MYVEIGLSFVFIFLGYVFNFAILLMPVAMMDDSPSTPVVVKIIQRLLMSYILFGPFLIGLYIIIHNDDFETLGADARMAFKTLYWMGLGSMFSLLIYNLVNLEDKKNGV